MENNAVINRINELCKSRSWTYYRLAKESGIAYSTLNNMLNKNNMPSIPTLERICFGFGITISQFFSDQDESVHLTSDQKDHLALWDSLDEEGKKLVTAYMNGVLDKQTGKVSFLPK